MSGNPSVGVALGGGGVRGFAHVPVLETIDDCGIVPAAIAGTSMGALIGALYASGKSGREIRKIIEDHSLTSKDGLKEIVAKKDALIRWLRALRPSWKGAGLLRADGYVRFLIEQMDAETFADLEVPLLVVTTDFHSRYANRFQRIKAAEGLDCAAGQELANGPELQFRAAQAERCAHTAVQDKLYCVSVPF